MDKEIALLLAEMLVKQDENTEQIKKINTTLGQFMDHSIKQFDQQQNFNEQFATGFKQQNNFNEKFLKQLDEQQSVSKAMLSELKEIKQTVVNFGDVDARFKALEERENQLENRLSTIERLLKAS
ncbi:hypothetical protein [Mucilaginibacter ginkgonis]|uniref:Uncharacterized protein n=1 Tax=Mucilaginibacter ginkgonis TaxID=2682091 RepID=A0A6I4HUS7_9SPHI|nr:hypothetical protein [Mucilaginibacter ginkgonis]QQL50068.1 hypothetical protein GO620_001040 [Mucilaginibacter ginkgonis]